MTTPLFYNLFPSLAGSMDHWLPHVERAQGMGFSWIYLNPIHYPGFSGSLYAVKDPYRLHPLLIPPDTEEPMERLRETLRFIHQRGMRVMMDLVINHTAKDSPLVQTHPEWFCRDEEGEVQSPSAIDPADTRRVTVWGDLAEIDNEHSLDKEALWDYWTHLTLYFLELGFDGFRCDAAYKVPSDLWRRILDTARHQKPQTLFVAETLGCRLPEVRALKDAGFDLLYNSSKWWNFDAPWCLEQHAEFGAIAPSISFPESHDTPRLMEETGGLEQVQRMRYVLAAIFSAATLMPIGYEFGFTQKLDVVHTRPESWETTHLDLGPFVRRLNHLKQSVPVFGVEGSWELLTSYDKSTIVLSKKAPPLPEVVVLLNKDWHHPQTCELPNLSGRFPPPLRMLRVCRDGSASEPLSPCLTLDPAEIVFAFSGELVPKS